MMHGTSPEFYSANTLISILVQASHVSSLTAVAKTGQTEDKQAQLLSSLPIAIGHQHSVLQQARKCIYIVHFILLVLLYTWIF